jgi:hypothetical protein
MSNSQNSANKVLFGALAVAGALVGGALLFHLLQSSSAVIEEIDALGPPKKEMNGLLSFAYFKDIMSIV